MAAEEFSDVAPFRERVEKLVAAQKMYQGIPISKTTRSSDPKDITFEANAPQIEEVASLARNYRFFHGEKEPTQFTRVLTRLRWRVRDEWACGHLDWLAEQYKDSMKATQISADLGRPVSNRTIIDLWFNSELFHSDKLKKEELRKVHSDIGEVASLFQLYVAILRCSSCVRMLHSVVYALDVEHQFVYSPNHHFGATEQLGESDLWLSAP